VVNGFSLAGQRGLAGDCAKMRHVPDKKTVRMLTLIARQVNNRSEWLSSAFYREFPQRGLFTH